MGLAGRPRPRRARPGARLATWTRCPTAARSTARSAWSSAFAALDALRAEGFAPARPIAVACFADEEGARFGVACAGSRLLTGALDPDRARGADRRRRHHAWPRRWRAAGHDPAPLGRDDETLRRVGTFVELHVEQGRGPGRPRPAGRAVGVARSGRTAAGGSTPGRANHAGTTRLADRHDPMLALAAAVSPPARAASGTARVATVGKVRVEPNGVNAIPSRGHGLAGRPRPGRGRTSARVVAEVAAAAGRRPGRGVVDRRRPPSTPALRDRPGASAARRRARCCPPAPGTTPASSPRPASRPRCCSSATRPASRTPRPSTPSRPTASAGVAALARAVAGAARDRLLVRARRAGSPAGGPAVARSSRWSGTDRAVDGRVGPRAGDVRLAGPGAARASPTRTRHAFHRALRGRTHDGGGTFWTWRERMYAVAARLDPDTYLALARATYAEMALAGVTCVGEFHYLHHPPAAAVRRPERDGGGAASRPPPTPGSGSPCSTPATSPAASAPAGHLPLERRPAAVLRRRRRRVGRPGRRPADRREAMRIGAAVHSVRAVPAGAPADRRRRPPPAGRCTCTCPSSRRRTRPAQLLRLHPDRAARRRRAARPDDHRRARHPPHRRRHRRCSARTGTTVCVCPTHRGRPRRRHRPGPAGSATRAPALPRQRPARVIDLLDEARALEMHERLGAASAAASRPPSCSPPLTAHGHRALGWPDAGRLAAGAPRRPGRRPAGHAAHRRRATRRRCCWPPPPPTCTPSSSTGARRVGRGRHVLGDVGGCCADAIEPLWEDRMSTLVTGIGELVTNDPAHGGPLGMVPDAAVVVEGGRVAWVGPRRARPGRRQAGRRRRPRGDPRLRRQPRPPGVRRRPGGASSRRGWRASPTTAAASPPPSPPPAPRRRRAARPARARWSPRCARRAPRPSRSRAATGSPSTTRRARCGWPREVTAGDHVPRRARRAGRGAEPATTTSRLVAGPMLAACAPHARWVDVFCEPASPHAFDADEARAVLDRRPGRRAGAAGARQPARRRARRAAGRRARRRQRRPLHAPDRRRRRRARRRRHRRDAAARRGVLHPLAVPGRPPAARRPG